MDWMILVPVGLFFLFALWLLPRWQTTPLSGLGPKDRFDCENEARKTLAQVLGGGLLLIGLYFTAQTVRVSETTLRIGQEQQVAERFTRAVDQLGHSSLQIRLGGIYSLERIAQDSDRDHWPVMEVLAAFVRDKAPRSSKALRAAAERARGKRYSETTIEGPDRDKIPEDIQAAVAVIGRRSTVPSKVPRVINLVRTDLRFLLLFKANLEFVSLAFANLNYSGLSEANLRGADMPVASLDLADLEDADLTDANLNGASLLGANLKGARLERASIRGADLSTARGLTKEQLLTVKTDQRTKLPTGLRD